MDQLLGTGCSLQERAREETFDEEPSIPSHRAINQQHAAEEKGNSSKVLIDLVGINKTRKIIA